MRLYQLNRRVTPSDPDFSHTFHRIASDLAISIAPFEDYMRRAIVEQALVYAESSNSIRDLYRAVEEEYRKDE